MHPYRDFQTLVRRISSQPSQWLWFQLFCLSRAIAPHERNNDFRKLTTSALFFVWIMLTLDIGPGVSSTHYSAITALVFLILGQQWELEKFRFGPLEVSGTSTQDSEPEND